MADFPKLAEQLLGRLREEAASGERDAGLDADLRATRSAWSALAAKAREQHRPLADELGTAVRGRPQPAAALINARQYDGPRDPDALLAYVGLSSFRPGQREAVQGALEGRDSLVVMPTGGGKSLCYQLPGLAGEQLTVVVSPLIALMADQCQRLVGDGHPAVMLASGMGEEDARASYDAIRSGRARIVFCAPERFAAPSFLPLLQQRGVDLFVVDEAHCLSEWGHDFRPDYLRLPAAIERLGRPPVMAATATATEAVAEEIVGRLGLRDPVMVRSGFDRPNLSLDVINFEGKGTLDAKRGVLLGALQDQALRPAIVYCGTRKDCESVAELIEESGVPAAHYHAGLSAQMRAEVQARFMRGDLNVIVATNAFGMGVDKANVRLVCHWAMPTSVEAYYQEAGRAGRDGEPGRALLLAARADLSRLVHFNQQRAVDPDTVLAYHRRLLGRSQGLTVEIDAPSDDEDRVALAIIERAGAARLAPLGGGRLSVSLTPTVDGWTVASICQEAKDRGWRAYRAIEAYATGTTCRRRTLLDHFGDRAPGAPIGRCCDVCDPDLQLPPPVHLKVRRAGSGSAKGAAAEPSPYNPDPELYAELVAWRKVAADDKPAYTVATNRTLEAIADLRPATLQALGAVKGVGPAFLERHGEAVLALVAGAPAAR